MLRLVLVAMHEELMCDEHLQVTKKKNAPRKSRPNATLWWKWSKKLTLISSWINKIRRWCWNHGGRQFARVTQAYAFSMCWVTSLCLHATSNFSPPMTNGYNGNIIGMIFKNYAKSRIEKWLAERVLLRWEVFMWFRGTQAPNDKRIKFNLLEIAVSHGNASIKCTSMLSDFIRSRHVCWLLTTFVMCLFFFLSKWLKYQPHMFILSVYLCMHFSWSVKKSYMQSS